MPQSTIGHERLPVVIHTRLGDVLRFARTWNIFAMSDGSSCHDGIAFGYESPRLGRPSESDGTLTIDSREVPMVVLYLSLLLVLGLVQLLLRWRVSRLEKRYARVASEADTLLKQVSMRPGNSSRVDPLVSARQQFDLAVVATKRAQVEDRYSAWQSFTERFAQFRRRLAGFQGRVMPYLGGVLDVAFVVVLLDWLGYGVTDLKTLLGM